MVVMILMYYCFREINLIRLLHAVELLYYVLISRYVVRTGGRPTVVRKMAA
jgi:hypothetical protein